MIANIVQDFFCEDLKLRGQKANHDGHTDIMIDIYRCTFM